MHAIPCTTLGEICFWGKGEGELLWEYPTASHSFMFRIQIQDTRNSPEKTSTTLSPGLHTVNPALNCTLLFQLKQKSTDQRLKVYSLLAPLSTKDESNIENLEVFPTAYLCM